MPVNTILCLSGGLDSAVLLAYLLNHDHTIRRVVNFQYGSTHNYHEKHAAKRVSDHYGESLKIIDLCGVYDSLSVSSALLGSPQGIPEGHYQEESMRRTVVPGRNLLFISVLAALAEGMGADQIALGVHAGDHFIYPDCRPGFIKAVGLTVHASTDGKVTVYTPFMAKDKTDIVKLGIKLKVPFELTRTCYTSQEIACGRCGSCQERLEAFQLAGAEDPLPYQSRVILPKK